MLMRSPYSAFILAGVKSILAGVKSAFILAGVELALRLPLDSMDYMGNEHDWVNDIINVYVIICIHV